MSSLKLLPERTHVAAAAVEAHVIAKLLLKRTHVTEAAAEAHVVAEVPAEAHVVADLLLKLMSSLQCA